MNDTSGVFYWDASAILSVLFRDSHSNTAHMWAKNGGVHFISTLGHAEVCAVIARMHRELILSDPLVTVSFEMLDQGPWRRLSVNPDREITQSLSQKWPLKGADLWHLAVVKTLRKDLPELVLFTFDKRLLKAGSGEALGPDQL